GKSSKCILGGICLNTIFCTSKAFSFIILLYDASTSTSNPLYPGIAFQTRSILASDGALLNFLAAASIRSCRFDTSCVLTYTLLLLNSLMYVLLNGLKITDTDRITITTKPIKLFARITCKTSFLIKYE